MPRKAQAKAAKAQPKRRGRPGRVGNQIFDMVQSLIADHKATRTGAFKQIAEKTGRNPGTVAANYYRVARQRGVQLRQRRRRGSGVAAVSRAGGRASRAASHLTDLMQQLSDLIRQQGSEIERLRKENARFGEIRRLLAR